MSAPTDVQRFPSLPALQETHAALLKRYRALGDAPDILAEVNRFIVRGGETGALLDTESDRWAAQSILDYWATEYHRATRELPEATLAEFDPELAPTLDDSLCPYLGLDTFKAAQKDRYFGRQQLVDSLVARLKDSRILALLGPSGSGKSSLVLAGLIPTLQDGALPGSAEWIYYPSIVPGAEPLESLARLVLPREADQDRVEAVAREFKNDPDHLATVMGRQQRAALIVVDQFEEVFTLCNDEGDRQAFVANLLRLTRSSGPRHTVILTMRDDFLGAVARLPSLAPQFEKIMAMVVPPTAAELRDAIERPAEKIGLKFEEGLVDLLLKDVVNEPAGLPLLQFTLLKLWESRDHNRITRAAYHRLGGGRESLKRSADEAWEELGLQENKDTARRILLELVRPTEGREFTSKRVRRQRLYQLGIPENRVTLALDRLVKARLLRVTPGETSKEDRIEVAHEALVRNWPKLQTWLEEERERLRHRIALTSAAEVWVEHGRDKQLLLRGVLLDEALGYSELADLESEYVAASREDRERALRRKRRITAGFITAGVVIVLGLAIGSSILYAKNDQLRQARVRDSVAADSIGQLIRLARESEGSAMQSASNALESEANARASAAVANAQKVIATSARDTANSLLGATRASSRDNLQFRAERSVLLALHAMATKQTPTANAALERSTLAWSMPVKLRPRNGSVMTMAVTPDDRTLATSIGNDVVLWDLSRGVEYRTLIGHTGLVRAIAFDRTGTRVVTASDDGTAKIWDARTGREIRTLRPQGSELLAIAFSPNGRYLATGGLNGTTTIWDPSSGRILKELRGHSTAIWDISFNANSKRMLTAGQDGRGLLWSVGSWRLVDSLENSGADSTAHPGGIINAEFDPAGNQVATAGKDNKVKLWNAEDGSPIIAMDHGEQGEAWDVSFSPNGHYLASGGSDQTVRIWDVSNGSQVKVLRGHIGTVYSVSFFDDDHVVSADQEGSGIVWDLSRDLESQRLQPSTNSTSMHSLAISPDGRRVLSGDDNGIVWSSTVQATGGSGAKPLSDAVNLHEREKRIQSMAIGATGRHLALVTADSLVLWDLSRGEARWVRGDSSLRERGTQDTLLGADLTPDFWGVAISPDDKYVAVAALDGFVRVYDVADGKLKYRRRAPTGEAVTVAFNPARPRQLATAGRDRVVRLWDAETGVLQDSLVGHTDLVLDLAFNATGTELASASGDGTVLIWDLAQRTREARVVLQGHENWVWSVSFSRDGNQIASSSSDQTVRIWDARSGESLREIPLPETQANVLEFGQSNNLFIAGLDGILRVYALAPISPEHLMRDARSRLRTSLTHLECRLELKLESCPETVESLLEKAQAAAARGDQRAAYSHFERARAKDPGLGLDAATYLGPTLGTYFINQSNLAANRGDVGQAAEHLRTARRWDSALPIDPQAEAVRKVAAYHVVKARELAGRGQLDSALARVGLAAGVDRELSRETLGTEMAQIAGKPMAPFLAARADSMARQFRLDVAIATMDSALTFDSTAVDANQLNSLCWFGSLRRMAARVLPYCNRAVRLSPGSTNIKDSRGLARALNGQVAGAIKDFSLFVDDENNAENLRNKRREWMVALRAGTAPATIFTDAVLRQLESE
jgi:WD40 repeat protein/energy-coupling factor transporter ATP-binding protein EcfA2